MQFDIFHSIGRVDDIEPVRANHEVLKDFFRQAALAEELQFETIWVAESHFSSELQKSHRNPVIPNYSGEVGLNADTMVLIQTLLERTTKINFGSAIHNIVGGNGGPIASSDRVSFLAFLNGLRPKPRELNIGIASGRFPYINAPFGIVPRDEIEAKLWPVYKRYIFLEALEIFLRLVNGEELESSQISKYVLNADSCGEELWQQAVADLGLKTAVDYNPRWNFEKIRIVPELSENSRNHLRVVLGSHDPDARRVGFRFADMDVFNLSFTPPDKINAVHAEMTAFCDSANREPWHRRRMPRTVLVFIDEDSQKAHAQAVACLRTYIEAMRGTVRMPPIEDLLDRALIGSPEEIIEQLSPENPKAFDNQDRLMLWFEFNQSNGQLVESQMQLFAEKVRPHFV